MRKKEKEIKEKSAIEAVILKSLVCHLGMSDNDKPYVVPVCFGYQDNRIYVHGSLKGMKIDILRKNENVCFQFDTNTEIVEAGNACDWDVKYQSVIGFGKASFVEESEEKRRALDTIMNHYTNGPFQIPEKVVHGTALIKIEVESMTGKQSGFK